MKTTFGFKDEYRFLSSFALVTIDFERLTYKSVEHAYQAAKTLIESERLMIQAAYSPGLAKRLGRNVTKRHNWDTIKYSIMLSLVRQKFSYPEYARLLKATGNIVLEEQNTWGDTYWGICNGIGENALGEILMQVRSEI